MKVSVIIRTKNEEDWIKRCLFAVLNQDYSDIEVIIIDSGSTDRTLEFAREFDVHIIEYKGEYFPGKALNLGARFASGQYLTFLSAHCIPLNDKWLERLLVCFSEDDRIAAVYGKQEPLPDSNLFDKRDLWTIFGKERRIQQEDYFFHNANSMIKRSIWEPYPFDETLLHIEDQAWAKNILSLGYHIVYEPQAGVYHYHGVNQGYNEKRAEGVVKIMDVLENGKNN